jgi:hypothetical protein
LGARFKADFQLDWHSSPAQVAIVVHSMVLVGGGQNGADRELVI